MDSVTNSKWNKILTNWLQQKGSDNDIDYSVSYKWNNYTKFKYKIYYKQKTQKILFIERKKEREGERNHINSTFSSLLPWQKTVKIKETGNVAI